MEINLDNPAKHFFAAQTVACLTGRQVSFGTKLATQKYLAEFIFAGVGAVKGTLH